MLIEVCNVVFRGKISLWQKAKECPIIIIFGTYLDHVCVRVCVYVCMRACVHV